MTDPQSHILVVDDDARIRDLLRRFLHRHGYLVTPARDAAQARNLLDGLEFDLIVLDIMMPGEDGLHLAASLRGVIATPILLLTARGDTDDRIRGLEAGADDYLSKPFEPRELLLRIAAILRRTPPPAPPRPSPPRALILGALRYEPERGTLWHGPDPVRLTANEAALLGILAAHPHEPVSRAALVEELGGGTAEAQERAIDVQITRLRRKIEADPRNPRYLQTVRGQGYRLSPD